jgi:hypothetical protein
MKKEERSHKAGEKKEKKPKSDGCNVGAGGAWGGARRAQSDLAMHEAIAATSSATRLLAAHFWPQLLAHQMAAPQSARLPRARSEWGLGAHCRLLASGKRHKLPNLARFRNHVVQTLPAHTGEMNRFGDAASASPKTHMCGCARFSDTLRTAQDLENDVIKPSG